MSRINNNHMVILHISDLHFGRPGNIQETDNRRLALKGLMNSLFKIGKDWRPNIICITGDIGWSGSETDYTSAMYWIVDLLKKLYLSPKHLFMCPGNHDVNWKEAKHNVRPDRTEDANHVLDIPIPEHFINPFKAFSKFCEDIGMPPFLFGKTKNYLMGVRYLENQNVFVSLNSSWFSKDDDDRNKLWIGLSYLRHMEEQGQLPDPEQLVNSPITIAMIHHPREWLHDSEINSRGLRPSTFDYLSQRCHLLLTGHSHSNRAAEKFDEGAWHLSSGATYQGSEYFNSFRIIRVTNNALIYRTFEYDPRYTDHSWNQRQAERTLNIQRANIKKGSGIYNTITLPEYCENIVSEFTSYNKKQEHPDSEPLMLSGYLFDDLLNHYISPSLIRHGKQTSDSIEDAISTLIKFLFAERECVIFVIADSGMGKSSLLLRLLYELSNIAINNKTKAILPIFVPLREYHSGESFNNFLLDLIKRRYGIILDKESFQKSLKDGEIALFLDGLDEISTRDYHFLPETVRITQKVIITAKKSLISSFDDLVIYALTENDLLRNEKTMDYVELFEIMNFDNNRREKYLKIRGHRELEAMLRESNLEAVASSPIALRFIADQPEILSNSRTLTDVYRAYQSKMTSWYFLHHSHPKPKWLTRDYVDTFLNKLALDCYNRNVPEFDTSLEVFTNEPQDRLSMLLEHPLLSRKLGCIYGFRHQSWVAYYVSKFIYNKLQIKELQVLKEIHIDRSVSVFTREMITSNDVSSIISQIADTASKESNDILMFNLSHLLQSFFLQRGFTNYTASQRADLLKELSVLKSVEDIIVEGYLARIMAQMNGPSAMAEHVKKLRSSQPFTERNVYLFIHYNHGIDGFVSQMVRHLKQTDIYNYCILLDLYMIEALLLNLQSRHALTLQKSLRWALCFYKDKDLQDQIDYTIQKVKQTFNDLRPI